MRGPGILLALLCSVLSTCTQGGGHSPPRYSLAILAAASTMSHGTSLQLDAIVRWPDGSSTTVTEEVQWEASPPGVVQFATAAGTRGLVTGMAPGLATVRATVPADRVVATMDLRVISAELTAIEVSPPLPSVAVGYNVPFAATGTYTDLTTRDLTTAVVWASTNEGVAVVDGVVSGQQQIRGVGAGTTVITATDPIAGVVGSTTLTVTAAVLVSIAVTPALPSMALGYTQQFAATGTFSDNSTQDLTTAVTWSSGTLATATISNAGGTEGLATSVATGTTTITATHAATSIAGSTTLTVTAAIAFRAASSASAGASTTTLTVPTPNGSVAGDVMIAAIAVRPSTATITPPSGWALVQRVDNSTPNTSSLAFYTRVAAGGEPMSHDWTFSSSNGSVGGILTFQGGDPGQIIDVSGGQATASSLTHAAPSVTTTVADTMLVTLHAFTSSSDWTPPTGMTEAVDVASGTVQSAAGISLCAAFVEQSSAGATGARSAVAGANADTGNAVSLALRP